MHATLHKSMGPVVVVAAIAAVAATVACTFSFAFVQFDQLQPSAGGPDSQLHLL
jgi:hypothetical protein